MDRRDVLSAGAGLAFAASTAGCLSRLGFETRSAGSPPLAESRPDAVYVPTHVDGMETVGTATAGPYACSLMYSYPHRFWLVTGQERQRVEVNSDDSIHLMARLWDAETGVVLPNGSVSFEIRRDGERVTERPPWPMLSQRMGFHFGDNVALPGEGSYDVTIGIDAVQARSTGAFRDRFTESAEAAFSFDLSQRTLESLSYETLGEQVGQRGAVEPMRMDMGMGDAGGGGTGSEDTGGTQGEDAGGAQGEGSGTDGLERGGMPMGSMAVAQLPMPDALPGRKLGEATVGDGTFVVEALDEPPAGIDGTGTYLAVSARTPYNRYPLPFMSVTATVERAGEPVFDGPVVGTLDPDLHFHYCALVESIESGDEVLLDVGAPPQVARHEGYETAFLDMEPASVTVQ